MRLPAQGVDHHHIKVAKQRARRRRDAAGVGQVGEVANSITGRANRAVAHRNGLDARFAHVERAAVDDRVANVRDEADPWRTGKGVGKPLAQRRAGQRIAKTG